MQENPKKKLQIRDLIVWIVFVLIAWYIFIGSFLRLPFDELVMSLEGKVSDGMFFTLEYYTGTIFDILILFILTWLFKKNRYIWKSFLLPKKGAAGSHAMLSEDDINAELYGRSNNSFRNLGIGLLLGFLTNFFCILCALIHGDIKLYFDASASQIPVFIFALICVCIQSSAEELWCRGFMYERIHKRYPLWVCVAVNGILFGLLHIFNPGVSALPVIGIIVCGFSYSLLRWYSGSIWVAMGIHTGWNFTQNYLFGLPNSGLVSEASLFHLDAANGTTTLIYDYAFGVEGGLPSVFIDALLGIVILVLAAKSGRLRELGMNREQTLKVRGLISEE